MLLLPTTCKIFSSILLSKYTAYVDKLSGLSVWILKQLVNCWSDILYSLVKRKCKYNGTVHHLFIDFREAFDLVRRAVFYNILVGFGMPVKLYTCRLSRVAFLFATPSVQPCQGHVSRHSSDWQQNISRSYHYKWTSSSCLLWMTSLNLVVLLDIADMSSYAVLWAGGWRIGAEQMFHTRLIQQPSFCYDPPPQLPLIWLPR